MSDSSFDFIHTVSIHEVSCMGAHLVHGIPTPYTVRAKEFETYCSYTATL